MIKVIITGATGFLGSHIVKNYLESGATVLAIGHRSVPVIGNDVLASRLKPIKLDICDSTKNLDVFGGYDLVIHSAAKLYANSPDEKINQEKVNIDGTKNIIEACLRNGVPRLLYISTTAAIGISPDPDKPADETFPYNLEHLDLAYNSTKHRAEQHVLNANSSSLETVVVNPGFIFGCDGEKYRGAEVIEPALRKRFIICTNGGLSIVHIDDVVDGIHRTAKDGRAGGRYIISGSNVTFPVIARTVGDKMGQAVNVLVIPDFIRGLFGILFRRLAKIRHTPPPLHLSRRYAYQFYSSEKARRELGYTPRCFEDIVNDYINFTRDSNN